MALKFKSYYLITVNRMTNFLFAFRGSLIKRTLSIRTINKYNRMKQMIPWSFFFLCAFLGACDASETDIESISSPDKEDESPVIEELTEDSFEDILNAFKILAIHKSDENINPTSNILSKSTQRKTISKEDECQHEITNAIENKDYTFDIARDYQENPLSSEEIDKIFNTPAISKTTSSVKYFTKNKEKSTDCETQELDAPVPNHRRKDMYQRPKFYNYSSIFDFNGSHSYSNEFYIERSERTEIYGVGAHSLLVTKGNVEKKIKRNYNVILDDLSTKHSYTERLNLTGYVYADRVDRSHRYKFSFEEGSSKYYSLSYTVKNELDNPVLESTEIDFVDSYKVLFYIRHKDTKNRTPWDSYSVPFVFEIVIDLEEMVSVLKKNKGETPYVKSSILYMKYGPGRNEKREVGAIEYTLDKHGEKWTITSKESPLIVSDSQINSIVKHYN